MTAEARQVLFSRVDALLDPPHSVADLLLHRVDLMAARRWRELGVEVPLELVGLERKAAATAMAAPALMERVRDAADGPLMLMKGPELACLYPDPAVRASRDLDIVVPDAPATQRRLVAAGFKEAGEARLFEHIHHMRPLYWPGLPLLIEVHHGLKWIDHFHQPATDELFEAAGPSRAGTPGVLAPSPEHHALMLTMHAWAHGPLSRLRDLIDIAAVASEADAAEIRRLATAWGMQRVWGTTARAIGAVLGDGRRAASLAIWARHVRAVREQTVLESHVQEWLCALWVLPYRRAITTAAGAVRADMVPRGGETWGTKLTRTRASLSNAFVRKSQHDEALDAGRGGS